MEKKSDQLLHPYATNLLLWQTAITQRRKGAKWVWELGHLAIVLNCRSPLVLERHISLFSSLLQRQAQRRQQTRIKFSIFIGQFPLTA